MSSPTQLPPLETYLNQVLNANEDELRAMFKESHQEQPRTAALGSFHFPWTIASKGAEHLSQHSPVTDTLAKSGNAVATSSAGPGIVSAIGSGPTNSANTDRVLNDGLFTDALNSVKADRLLRTMFIGWAGGAQVGIVGGGGGSGVASDVIDSRNKAGVGYSSFNLGIGARAGTGLLVGAMSRPPRNLSSSTQIWEFGASLVGIGANVTVIMDSDDLQLIGFTLNLGVGVGLSSSTGYGSIWVV
jgi:hypothetical protein